MTKEPNGSDPKKKPQDRATLGGETVEPRILLSASWLVDLMGALPAQTVGDTGGSGDDLIVGDDNANTLDGKGGDDILRGEGGDDTLIGGAGIDVADYSTAGSGVNVDLSAGTASGGAGNDTLSGIEAAAGSSYDDTFAFANAADGEVYSVLGNGGSDTLNLTGYQSSAATFADGSIRIDLGNDESFQVEYDQIDTIAFGDISATVLTDNLSINSFSGAGIFVDGDQAFLLDVGGAGAVDWSYDVTTDELVISDTTNTDATTSLTIADLNGQDLQVGTISVDCDLGNLNSNVDIDALDISGNSHTIDTISIDDGNGTLGSFHASHKIDAAMTIDANVGSAALDASLQGVVTISGNLGSLSMGRLDVSGGVHILGDVGSIATGDVLATLEVDGNLGTLSTAYVSGDMAVHGDLDAATITSMGSTGSLQVDKPVGVVRLTVGGVTQDVDSGGVGFTFDGATQSVEGAPDADAGTDQVVNEGDLVTLDASASSDADGDPLTYSWVQVSGPTVELSDPSAANPTFTAPEGLANTMLEFKLTASDGTIADSDSVTIQINADNDAPTANAGSDQSVQENDVVTLNGAASTDPEGKTLTYTWVQTSGPAVTLSDSNAAQPTFTAPEGLTNSTVKFQLTVSDSTNDSVDTVSIAINADNDAPAANAGTDQSVSENDLVTLTATASTDPEGQALTYTWVQTSGPAVTLSDANAAQPTFTAPEGLSNSTVQFQLSVSDGTNVSVDTVDVTINADNDGPTAAAGSDQVAYAGDVVTLDAANSTDPEGQALTYTWSQVSGPAVTLSDSNAAQPTFTSPDVVSPTHLTFEVSASDGTNTNTDTVTAIVNPQGLIANWTFDGTGQTVTDITGNGHDGTLGGDSSSQSSDPTRFTDSDRGEVLRFDGNDYVGNIGQGPSGDFSLSSWINHDGTGSNWRTVFSSGDGETWIGINATTGKVTMCVGGISNWLETNPGVVNANTWQHIAGTWDGTDAHIYLDGVDMALTTIGSPSDPVAADALIGKQVGYSSEWNGMLDDVRVYDRAIAAGDVAAMAGNAAPTAEAGGAQVVNEGDVVTLDATGSSDPESQTLTYTWVQTAGPAVTLSDANAAQPTFTAPEGLANTAVSFQLTATDSFGASTVDTVDVAINADNDAPTASAGADQSVNENDLVTLDATASTDPEGQALTYTWVQTSGPAVSLSDASAAQPTFTAPEGITNSTVQFQLTASDGTNVSIDTVSVTIAADNDAPTAAAGTNQSVDEGDSVTLDATGSTDPEGQELTYSWVQVSGPAVTLSDASAAQPTFTAPEGLANTTVQFQLTASDGTNASVDTVDVTINADNDAPTADAGPDQSVNEGDVVTLNAGESTDPEGQALTYSWVQTSGPAVSLSDASAAQPTFTAPEGLANSTVQFELTVNDGSNTSVDTVDITVNADNDAPSAEAGSNQTVDEGDLVALDARGSTDPEGQTLTYSWTQVSGPSVTLSDSTVGAPTFTAPQGISNSTVQFELTVSDGTNTSVDTVDVTINATNEAPTANAGPNNAFGEGNIAVLNGSGSSDPEGQTLTYSWRQIAGPSVNIVNANSAVAGFVVPEGLSNSGARFELTVSDGQNTSVDTVDLLLRADNDAPTANAGTDRTVDEGQIVVLDGGNSTDPEGQSLTYTWEQISGPPVQLQAIPGTPSVPTEPGTVTQNAGLGGAYSASVGGEGRMAFQAPEGIANSDAVFRLTVSDGTNTSVDTVTIHINADDDAPVVDAGNNQVVASQQQVQLSATAQDPENQGLHYQWAQVGGPAVQLTGADTANPTFVTPTGHTGEAMVFVVAVTDGTSTAYDTVAVGIHNTPPVVVAGSSGDAISGEPVVLAAAAQDIDGDHLTYRWTQVSGPTVSLGAGNQQQAFFQAPTVSNATQVTFQVEVDDGHTTSSRLVTVTIEPEPEPTTGGGGSEDPLPATLPPEPEPQPQEPSSGPAAPTNVETTTPEPQVPSGNELDPPQTQSPLESQNQGNGSLGQSGSTGNNAGPDESDDDDRRRQSDESEANDDTQTTESVQQIGDGDAVIVSAGTEIDISALLAVPEGEDVQFTWKQVSGTAVTIVDGTSSALRIQLPETFSTEELVFEVEMMVDGQIIVQEVTVEVQPVDSEAKDAALAEKKQFQRLTASHGEEFEAQRGIGKVWASLVAFTSMAPRRRS